MLGSTAWGPRRAGSRSPWRHSPPPSSSGCSPPGPVSACSWPPAWLPAHGGPEREPAMVPGSVLRFSRHLHRPAPAAAQGTSELHGNLIVPAVSVDPAGGVHLPPVDHGEPVLEGHGDPAGTPPVAPQRRPGG